jgi:hypothetical protein
MALTSRQISCEEISATTALRLSECRPHAASWPLRIAFRPAALTIHRISDAASALPAEPPSTSSSSRKPPRRSSAPIDFLPRRFFWSGATVTAASFNLFSLLVSRIRILILAFAGIELNLVPRPLFHGRFLRPQRRTQQYCNWHGQPQCMCQHGRARLAHIRHHASVV